MDRDFILNGLKNGFSIIDESVENVKPAFTDNHRSAILKKDKVEAQIIEEINEGNYSVVNDKPKIISALAAIDKPNGDIRLIHDLSLPTGYSVNDYAKKDECKFQSFKDALALVSPNSFMAKVDLKSAYRSVLIKVDEQTLTGLQWTFKETLKPLNIIDRCLPFGARKSPAIFNRITQAVQRMMERRGYKVIVYLDDFFVCEDTFARCRQGLTELIMLLRSLNFKINWKKVVDPCKSMTFLGINIDIPNGVLSLDQVKTRDLCAKLQYYATKKRISKVQLQGLAGKLSWACNVTPWGRSHLAPFFQLIRLLKGANHKVRLLACLRDEIEWWHSVLSSSTNQTQIWDTRPPVYIATDACNAGGGAFCQGASIYINWLLDRPTLAATHINMKELAMIKEAASFFAPAYKNHHLVIYTDNQCTAHIVNKGYSKNRLAASIMKDIAIIGLQNNCRITCKFIPGTLNEIPDALSRLHAIGQWQRFQSLLSKAIPYLQPTCIMSHLSAIFLQRQWMRDFPS